MSEDSFNLRPIWDAILDIYIEFSQICERHKLRYYAFAGTALGAVRHNGFIPWDDDLDVAMPRPDYEKLVKLIPRELPSYMKFVNWRNTPELNILAGKIQDVRADKIAAIEKKTGRVLSNGLFIDVYPIDGYPRGAKAMAFRLKQLILLQFIWRFRTLPINKLSVKGKICWVLGAFFCVFMPKYRNKKDIMLEFERMLLAIPFETSSIVGDIGYSLTIFLHQSLPKNVWGEPVWHKFEHIQVPLPANVDAHLKNNYGDYMTLPPEEKRTPSHAFDFHYPWWLGPTQQETNLDSTNEACV